MAATRPVTASTAGEEAESSPEVGTEGSAAGNDGSAGGDHEPSTVSRAHNSVCSTAYAIAEAGARSQAVSLYLHRHVIAAEAYG